MSKNSSIEWTDHTWNVVTGCTKVSQGCAHCFAERIASRFWGARKFSDVQCHPERLDQISHWRKPAKIFVNSMSDLFHERVPFEFIDAVFHRMYKARQHKFIILTKRPDQMLAYMRRVDARRDIGNAPEYWQGIKEWLPIPFPLPNVWLGVSVEDQKTADKRIPLLLQTPAALRFVSVEPMLGEIDLRKYLGGNNETKEFGRTSLSSGEIGGTGNRRSGENLENSQSAREQMGGRNESDQLQPTPSRAPIREVYASEGDDQLETISRYGSPISLVSLLRENTRGIDDQSQERETFGQQTREFRIGNLFGANSALDPYSGSSAGAKQDGSILWVICGGESGPGARPMHPDWARSVRDQCQEAGVKFFFKGWGEWKPVCPQYPEGDDEPNLDDLDMMAHQICLGNRGTIFREDYGLKEYYWCGYQPTPSENPWFLERVGKKAAGRLLDGRTWDEFPGREPKEADA